VVSSSFLISYSSLVNSIRKEDFKTDVGSRLNGRTIHVQSLRWKGKWLRSRDRAGKWIKVDNCAERDVYYKDWTQFKVSQH